MAESFALFRHFGGQIRLRRGPLRGEEGYSRGVVWVLQKGCCDDRLNSPNLEQVVAAQPAGFRLPAEFRVDHPAAR